MDNDEENIEESEGEDEEGDESDRQFLRNVSDDGKISKSTKIFFLLFQFQKIKNHHTYIN